MIYSSPDFVILLLSIVAIFLSVRSYDFRFFALIIASLLFYSWSGVFDTVIFALVVLVSWFASYLSLKFPARRRWILTFGICVMAFHLFFWKYAPWVARNIQVVWPKFLNGESLSLPLPIGISFFTLQGIAYLVDLERGEAPYIPFFQYLLFKSFFAQLVAGPIVRVHQLLPQLKKLGPPSRDDIAIGLSLFCMGFFKKLLIADQVSIYADVVFNLPAHYSRYVLLKAILAYTVQIWADFSGYTDMGRGAARMLGIKLPENFLSPYFCKSPSEFWKRWHITLSEWIRDYIYIPLGGSHGRKLRVFFVVILTMSLSGLWHGASFTFIIWGLYHGVLLVGERFIKRSFVARAFLAFGSQTLKTVFLRAMMFGFISFGWLLFRAQGFYRFKEFIKGLLRNSLSVADLPSSKPLLFGVIFCFLFQWLAYYDFETRTCRAQLFWSPLRQRYNSSRWAFPLLVGGGLGLSVVMSIFFRHISTVSSFIYFQF